MIGKKKLTKKEKEVLKGLVKQTCEQCKKKFQSRELEIHRIIRGNEGGTYRGGNTKILCSECHRLYHANEPNMRSK